MKFTHIEGNEQGMIYHQHGTEKDAVLRYKLQNQKLLNIISTDVVPELRGRGIGMQLVEEAIAYARMKNYKVVADCSFAHTVLEKNASKYSDVWENN